MLGRRTRSPGFALRIALSLVAMAIEALVPLVVAGDILAVEARALPICSAGGHASVPAGDSGQHRPLGASPISAALAVAAAITAPGEVPLPMPAGWQRICLPIMASAGQFRSAPSVYNARGPPRFS
jgi:hypothetical protein